MAQKDSKEIQKPQTGIFNELLIRIKLVLRLMADPRVKFLYKLIPVSSLVYFLIPTDLVPLIPIDDAVVIWLATYLFVELAPPEVVQEHLDELRQIVPIGWEASPDQFDNSPTGEVVDAEYKEVEE